jgi:hypothetical protein
MILYHYDKEILLNAALLFKKVKIIFQRDFYGASG